MVKIIQPAQIETHTVGDIMAVKIPKQLMRDPDAKDWFFFIDLKQVKKKSLDFSALTMDRSFRRYSYVENIKEINNHVRGNDYWDELEKLHTNSIKLLKSEKFNPKNLYFFGDYDWYAFRSDMPMTHPILVSYISGVTSSKYDVDKAEKILRKNRWVSQVERIDIPYYNIDSCGSQAVEFVVRLPQKVLDKLVRYYRDEQKEEYWILHVRDCVASSYQLEPFDVLGLKAALKQS